LTEEESYFKSLLYPSEHHPGLKAICERWEAVRTEFHHDIDVYALRMAEAKLPDSYDTQTHEMVTSASAKLEREKKNHLASFAFKMRKHVESKHFQTEMQQLRIERGVDNATLEERIS